MYCVSSLNLTMRENNSNKMNKFLKFLPLSSNSYKKLINCQFSYIEIKTRRYRLNCLRQKMKGPSICLGSADFPTIHYNYCLSMNGVGEKGVDLNFASRNGLKLQMCVCIYSLLPLGGQRGTYPIM